MIFQVKGNNTIRSFKPQGGTDYVSITVIGTPIAKASLKTYFNRAVNKLIHYQPSQPEIQEFQKIVAKDIQEYLGNNSVLFKNGAHLKICIHFFFQRKKTHYKSLDTKCGVLNKNAPKFPTYPDLDNLLKFSLDLFNGVLYKDDCQVTSIKTTKTYIHHSKPGYTIMEATRI